MKITRPKGLGVVVIIALLLMATFLILGDQSFKATAKTNLYEFNRPQLVLAREATGGIDLHFESLAADAGA